MPDPTPCPGCRFCLDNGLLCDAPIPATPRLYLLDSIDPEMPEAVMVVPYRHAATPFEMTSEDMAELPAALEVARARLARWQPEGFTIGWNVGAVGGQTVGHVHLHVIARRRDGHHPHTGIRVLLKRD